MAETHEQRLRRFLAELFMFDQADLDFGVYRILDMRRGEIQRFLNEDLLRQVRETLDLLAAGERQALAAEIRDAKTQARKLGMAPNEVSEIPRVRELQARYAAAPDTAAAADDVYSHLVSFFRRYYRDGDFISQRRYKEGIYAIPYEGEEVKLHWANADQYYVKSSEQFRDYSFRLSDAETDRRRVHFKLIDADIPTNNNLPGVDVNKKSTGGGYSQERSADRRFLLATDAPVSLAGDALTVRFEYRPDSARRRQRDLNDLAVQRILADPAARAWRLDLARAASNAADAPSLLARHLSRYTARNTFDYFIHKDLGGFLRRELDFYLKNEVMRLDDIDTDGVTARQVERYLAKLKAIRRVGRKLIDFLAQLEDFQKRLWLKKKFVVETHWCVTLDRVPQTLYFEIAANEAQRQVWVDLFAIDEIKGDPVQPDYSEPLTVNFLRGNQYLPVDTSLFDRDFTERLLTSIDNLDDATDGLLIHGDNFQALNLLQNRYQGKVKCVYIDPPYNTSASEILYKNNYKHSSWMSLMLDRLSVGKRLLNQFGIQVTAIDDTEFVVLGQIIDEAFVAYDRETVVVNHHPGGSGLEGANISATHEYAIFSVPSGEKLLFGPDKENKTSEISFIRGGTAESNLRIGRPNSFYAVLVEPDSSMVVGAERPPEGNDYPRGMTADGYMRIYPLSPDGTERVWRRSYEGFQKEIKKGNIVCNNNLKLRLISDNTNKSQPIFSNWKDKKYNAGFYGSVLLRNMLGGDRFSYPKSIYTVMDCVAACTKHERDSIVVDYFAGSGTTGHAVINLNREDGGRRKYILVEMGEYFDTVLKPRVLKATYSKDWKQGKPIGRDGVSQIVKVIRLESYEDTLNNLEVRRDEPQMRLLSENPDVREEYLLRYWTAVETRGNPSLLSADRFDDPWSYVLQVARGAAAETRPVTVDLIETFNYLLGLRVWHVDRVHGATLVRGVLPSGERALVVWRKTADPDGPDLTDWLWYQPINPRDLPFDLVYVNGDNQLASARRADETWEARLIEDEFRRLMFEAADQP